MTEAWFLHDADAIRGAAGNPNGKDQLDLPATQKSKNLVDPKEILFNALIKATGSRGRRKQKNKAKLTRLRFRVAELIDDDSPLIRIPVCVHPIDDIQKSFTKHH